MPSDSPAPAPDQGEITLLLLEASRGNRPAFDRLLPLVYDELRRLARSKLRLERAHHTLSATALVHEAYLNLIQQDRVEWRSRSHFFAVASQAMRRILVNYAVMKQRDKRGGGAPHVALEEAEDVPAGGGPLTDDEATELLALDEALQRLRAVSEQGADVVQYRFFGGLGYPDIAEVMGVSEVTVRRRWTLARSWLRRELDAQFGAATGGLLTTTPPA